MADKKDPGKFTIRFNIADPQQRAAVELLNRQGRYKAQFITSAVLFYAYAASDAQTVSLLNGAALQTLTASSRSEGQENALTEKVSEIRTENIPDDDSGNDLEDMELDAIRRTMETFRPT